MLPVCRASRLGAHGPNKIEAPPHKKRVQSVRRASPPVVGRPDERVINIAFIGIKRNLRNNPHRPRLGPHTRRSILMRLPNSAESEAARILIFFVFLHGHSLILHILA